MFEPGEVTIPGVIHKARKVIGVNIFYVEESNDEFFLATFIGLKKRF